MRRFDVYENPEGGGYVLDVQADLLTSLHTRVVVPLMPASAAPVPAKSLNQQFEVEGEPVVMVTQFLAAVPASLLKTTITNLESRRDDITAALDLLFQGF